MPELPDVPDDVLRDEYDEACHQAVLDVHEIQRQVMEWVFNMPEFGFHRGRLPDEPEKHVSRRKEWHEHIFRYAFEEAEEYSLLGQAPFQDIRFRNLVRTLHWMHRSHRTQEELDPYEMIILFKIQIVACIEAARRVRVDMFERRIDVRESKYLDQLGKIGAPSPYEDDQSTNRLPSDWESFLKLYKHDYLALQIARDHGIEVILPTIPLRPGNKADNDSKWYPRGILDPTYWDERPPVPLLDGE